MTAGYIGNRHPGLGSFQDYGHFLLCGITPAALDPAEDFDSISIRRHSRMTRRTPSSYLSDCVRFKWGLLHWHLRKAKRCGRIAAPREWSAEPQFSGRNLRPGFLRHFAPVLE